MEGKRLAEVFRLVNDLTDVYARLSDEAYNFIDVSFFHLLKEGLMERVWLPTGDLVILGWRLLTHLGFLLLLGWLLSLLSLGWGHSKGLISLHCLTRLLGL